MTSNIAGEFFTSNLLDELKLEPSWEKIRRYLFYACVAISVFATYNNHGVSVECLPGYSNATVGTDRTFRSQHVNKYCGNRHPLSLIRYAGFILQFANIWLLAATSFWLYVFPEVIDSFRTFAKIRDAVLDIGLRVASVQAISKRLYISTNESDREISSSQDEDVERALFDKFTNDAARKIVTEQHQQTHSEKTGKFLNAYHLIQLINTESKVASRYLLRNIVTVISIVLQASFLLAYARYFVTEIGNEFVCDYKLAAPREIYLCVYGENVTTLICTFFYVICLVLQLVAIGCGVMMVRKSRWEFVETSPEKFIITFWKSCNQTHHELLTTFFKLYHPEGKYLSDIDVIELLWSLTDASKTAEREHGKSHGSRKYSEKTTDDPENNTNSEESDENTEKINRGSEQPTRLTSSDLPGPSSREDEIELTDGAVKYLPRRSNSITSAEEHQDTHPLLTEE